MISMSDVQYFKEVAATLNISRAAERLGVRQSTLSASIKRLEESIGTPLLIRTKRGVHLTKGGSFFVTASSDLLEKWLDIKAVTLQMETELRGPYNFGVHAIPGQNILPKFMPSLLKENPLLELNLIHDTSPKLTEMVISSKLDFAIIAEPFAHPDLIIKPLLTETVGFWRKKAQSQRSYEDTTLLFDPEFRYAHMLLGQAKKEGVGFSRSIHSSSMGVLTHLVDGGVGIGILPELAVHQKLHKNLELIRELPMIKGNLTLVYRYDRHKSTLTKQILSEIKRGLKRI